MLESPAWAFAPLGVVVAMLVAVYFLDRASIAGSAPGRSRCSPSEFAKPALIIFLAYFVTQRLRGHQHPHDAYAGHADRDGGRAVVVVADLGTAVVLVTDRRTVFFVAGWIRSTSRSPSAAGMLLAAVAVIAKPYRLAGSSATSIPSTSCWTRLDSDRRRCKNYIASLAGRRAIPSYQVRQSKIAVGTGGFTGAGLMHRQAEAALSAGGAHRFHLRGGRRGAGALGVLRGSDRFYRDSVAGTAPVLGGPRRFRPLPGAGGYDLCRRCRRSSI